MGDTAETVAETDTPSDAPRRSTPQATTQDNQAPPEGYYISRAELDSALTGFSAILPPVFFTMVLSAFTVLYVTPDADETFQDSSLLLFDENNATSSSQAAGFGLANAFIIIGVITFMTFLIVLLIYMECEIFFKVYLFIALVMLMGFTTGLMVEQGLQYYSVPTDIITLAIFFYNFAIVGALSIFSYEVGFQGTERIISYKFAQFYLVIISVVMSWLVTAIFPNATIWALLVLLALYDLCAVLTPCGPLNLLIQVVTKRQEKDEARQRELRAQGGYEERGGGQGQMIPGLLYEVNTGAPNRRKKKKNNAARDGAAVAGVLAFMAVPGNEEEADRRDDEEEQESEHVIANEPSESATRNPQVYKEEEYDDEVTGDSNLKLGLGDFVFYSVLTAKSAEFGLIAFISVACCVLCGLCGTLVLLSVFQKALPALPISIALGVVTYLIAFQFISPFADQLTLSMVNV